LTGQKKKSQTLPYAVELIVVATSSQPITGAFRDCAWITGQPELIHLDVRRYRTSEALLQMMSGYSNQALAKMERTDSK
jgi:hypothetical protein